MDKIYKSFNTIIEMLSDREIVFPTTMDAGQIEKFIMNQSNKPGFEIILGEKIRLVYYLVSKFKWSELKKFFEEDKKYDLTILVVREKISANNMKQLATLGIEIQTFMLKELQINISKHAYVPKHELVKDQREVKNIMETYSLKGKNQIPIILKTDPMAKWLNLKTGDIIRISRPSQSAGYYIAYRCCL